MTYYKAVAATGAEKEAAAAADDDDDDDKSTSIHRVCLFGDILQFASLAHGLDEGECALAAG